MSSREPAPTHRDAMASERDVQSALHTLQRAITAPHPALVDVLSKLAAQNDRLILLAEQQLISTRIQEALAARTHNLSSSFVRPSGPYKIVKNTDGQDPTMPPHVRFCSFKLAREDLVQSLPGLWYLSSIQSLSLEQASKYLDFYGYVSEHDFHSQVIVTHTLSGHLIFRLAGRCQVRSRRHHGR